MHSDYAYYGHPLLNILSSILPFASWLKVVDSSEDWIVPHQQSQPLHYSSASFHDLIRTKLYLIEAHVSMWGKLDLSDFAAKETVL